MAMIPIIGEAARALDVEDASTRARRAPSSVAPWRLLEDR